MGQINPFPCSGKIHGIVKPKRIYQNRSILSHSQYGSILSKYLVDTRLFLSSVGFESSLQRIRSVTTDNGPHHSMENRRIGYDTDFLTFNGFRSDSHETEKRRISCLGLFQVSRSKKGKYVVSCRQERKNRAIGKLTLQGIL